ncbi:hypothetical protein D3C87_2152780 [compost metagenome]
MTSNCSATPSKLPVNRGSGTTAPALLTTMFTSVAMLAKSEIDWEERTSSAWGTTDSRESGFGLRAVT